MFLKNKIFPNIKSFVPSCLCGIFIFFLPNKIFSQQSVVPLNQEWLMESEAQFVRNGGFPLANSLMNFEVDSTLRALVKANDKKIGDPEVIISISVPIHSSMRPWNENGHPLRKNICLQNS